MQDTDRVGAHGCQVAEDQVCVNAPAGVDVLEHDVERDRIAVHVGKNCEPHRRKDRPRPRLATLCRVPVPLDVLTHVADLPNASLSRQVDLSDGTRASIQFVLYDCLRREQVLLAGSQPHGRSEIARILDLVQMAYGELVGLLIGRNDELLKTARDGEWSLRDLLRHAIAVELRYAAQVDWAATRRDDDPLSIPDARLPCDRLSPPEPEFADSRDGGMTRVLELLGVARARSDASLDPIPDAALTRPTLWGKLPMTLRMRLHQMAAHLTEVVVQGEKCLAPRGPDSEVRRIIRHCCRLRGAHERWSAAGARDLIDVDYRRMTALAI